MCLLLWYWWRIDDHGCWPSAVASLLALACLSLNIILLCFLEQWPLKHFMILANISFAVPLSEGDFIVIGFFRYVSYLIIVVLNIEKCPLIKVLYHFYWIISVQECVPYLLEMETTLVINVSLMFCTHIKLCVSQNVPLLYQKCWLCQIQLFVVLLTVILW